MIHYFQCTAPGCAKRSLTLHLSPLNLLSPAIRWKSHFFSCHLSEPPEETRKPQPRPDVFHFPSTLGGWLDHSSFVQSWSTRPASGGFHVTFEWLNLRCSLLNQNQIQLGGIGCTLEENICWFVGNTNRKVSLVG